VAQPHPIRDISSSGLYVVTKDRWYLGTLIRMTLTITDPARQGSEKSISVHAKAVRYGEDGVGLQFVLATSRDRKKERDPMVDWLDKVDMDRFLRQVYGG
jgi:methyl coenzyme M reductase gamma subunit